MKEIPLAANWGTAIVDDEDYDLVKDYRWHAARQPRKKSPSAVRTYIVVDNKVVTVAMHRMILGLTDPNIPADHINRNPFDNRRSNLRIVTVQQNNQNRGPQKNKAVPYKGVHIGSAKSDKPFRAEIKHNHKVFRLGSYPTPELAARAYDTKAKELFGEFAYLNFPNAVLTDINGTENCQAVTNDLNA